MNVNSATLRQLTSITTTTTAKPPTMPQAEMLEARSQRVLTAALLVLVKEVMALANATRN